MSPVGRGSNGTRLHRTPSNILPSLLIAGVLLVVGASIALRVWTTVLKNPLQQDNSGQVPKLGGMHNAVDPQRGISLGLALTNVNGLNYGYDRNT
jgi:hypothetical protein